MFLRTSRQGKFYHTASQKCMESHHNILVYCENFWLTKYWVRQLNTVVLTHPGPIPSTSIAFCLGSPNPCSSDFLPQAQCYPDLSFSFPCIPPPSIYPYWIIVPASLFRHCILPSSPSSQGLSSDQLPVCSQLPVVASLVNQCWS